MSKFRNDQHVWIEKLGSRGTIKEVCASAPALCVVEVVMHASELEDLRTYYRDELREADRAAEDWRDKLDRLTDEIAAKEPAP